MTTNAPTHPAIATIITEIGTRRLRSWSARVEAKDVASRVLSPLVPVGTLGWLVVPRVGESARAYAERAVQTAAARASWAGGLTDGTHVSDAAVRQSVAAIQR